ncbi:hypothetical protein E4U42_007919 [Claviceps africana]|uniref:RNB domain-containing protein n=1 Tax=Claviceps africana TaxID=83212 RepID=A0A8K0J0J9_9HYPO|nr:hypothetical protein E4U42_007919 [Claviceps africana]
MIRQARSSFVRWTCISQAPAASASIRAGVRASLEVNRNLFFRRYATTQISSSATPLLGKAKIPAFLKDDVDQSTEDNSDDDLPIRERLGQWLKINDTISASFMPPDAHIYGGITNSLSRTQSSGSSELDELRSTSRSMTEGGAEDSANTGVDVTSVGSASRRPGDLVEMRQMGSRVPVFAVYLGYFGARNHFYAVNGKWITSMGFSPLFSVSNFVTQEELLPVLAKIPQNGTPDHFDQLRRLDRGPSREDGDALINKMAEFRSSSEAIYQKHMDRLDGARGLLSDTKSTKYLSLFEIAEVLLPAALKADLGFSPPALYAVHTALFRDDIGFSPLSPSADCHRRDHLFEVFPSKHVDVISKVTTWVREYADVSTKKVRPLNLDELEEVALGRFILQARDAVLRSRQTREWTPHGILKTGPSVTLPRVDWSPVSKDVIAFLEWWASYDLFDAGSRYHSYGALILRSLQLYEDALLDRSTAWTLLQEMGVISPWEIPSRYKVRFPDTTIDRGGGIARVAVPRKQLKTSIIPDIAAGARTPREGSPVFCIDAPSTTLIDDGISLERTSRANEYWIHIHAADPASKILPKSELRRFLELIPENIYLPGHFQAMLPSDLGQDSSNDYTSDDLIKHHSLRPGAPALTFSALVNESGDVLEYQIAPSTLNEVTYLDPEDVSEFCGEEDRPAITRETPYSFDVGTLPDNSVAAPERPMTSTQALDDSSKADLLTLSRLAHAIKQKRLVKGAWPFFFPRSSVEVSFHEAIPEAGAAEEALLFPPDPYIKVGLESSSGCSLVSSTMVLAGEIAARWCSDRGIPIPYRKDAKSSSPDNMDAAFQYATKEIYPLIRKGIEPSASHREALFRLTGGVQLSTEPGPYFLLGLDMYAKATSPLRRFGDLIVHWQIHAALAHERTVRRRMDASVDDVEKILPFSKASLGETLSLLDMREKMGRTVGRGTLDWILIALVRAWRFEGKAPRTLRFTVSTRWRQGLLGKLDMFDLNAAMDIGGLDGCRLVKDVQIGDEFEVELADVNVHSQQILVRALRYLGKRAASS